MKPETSIKTKIDRFMVRCAGLCEHERLRLQTEDIVSNAVLDQ